MTERCIDLDGEVYRVAGMLDGLGEKTEEPQEVCTLLICKHPEGASQDYWSLPIKPGSFEKVLSS